MPRLTRFLALLILLGLVACAEESNPIPTVETYLQARVSSNTEELQRLSCAEWEAQAALQADSFRGMDAKLEGLSCASEGEDGDFTLVACQGKIVTTYNGETREWPLGTYRLTQEDDEWKFCGEAE